MRETVSMVRRRGQLATSVSASQKRLRREHDGSPSAGMVPSAPFRPELNGCHLRLRALVACAVNGGAR